MQIVKHFYILLLLGLLVALPNSVVAQEPSAEPAQEQPFRDVDGWGTVTWGTTLVQAREDFAAQIKKDPEQPPRPNVIRLNNIKVGDVELGVLLDGTADGLYIRKIQLVASLDTARKEAYDKLKAMMLKEYGAARREDRKTEGEVTNFTAVWVFPTTSITLRTFGPKGLDITYEPTADDALQ